MDHAPNEIIPGLGGRLEATIEHRTNNTGHRRRGAGLPGNWRPGTGHKFGIPFAIYAITDKPHTSLSRLTAPTATCLSAGTSGPAGRGMTDSIALISIERPGGIFLLVIQNESCSC